MPKVSFYAERAAIILQQPHRIISITEGEHRAAFPIEHKAVLRLSFHDVDGYLGDQYTQFSAHDANRILDFIGNVEEDEVLIVHCQAGISRSAAVAKFLIQHKDYQLAKDRFCNGDMGGYNARVYGLLRMIDLDRQRP